MNLLVLTSSARRHRALIWRLSQMATVNVILEDPRPRNAFGPSQQAIAIRVIEAEKTCFTDVPNLWHFRPHFRKWQYLDVPPQWIEMADRIIVYGTSIIREPLFSQIQEKAINLHAGWAPQYRGSHSNFWALYDGHPEYVGMTIQALDADVDAGGIWQQVGVQPEADPFLYAMKTIKAGFDVLAYQLAKAWAWPAPKAQDISQLIRYSRHADYTEEVAREFLEKYRVVLA